MRRLSTFTVVPIAMLSWAAWTGPLHADRHADRYELPRLPLRLTFAGDIMAHEPNLRVADFADIYAAIAPLLRNDDLSFANLEFPVDTGAPPAGYPRFNGTAAYARAAVEAGFEVLSLANNHAYDRGRGGVASTAAVLRGLAAVRGGRVWFHGTRTEAERAFAPVTLQVGGWRIGYVAATEHANFIAGAKGYVNVVHYQDAAAREQFLQLVAAVAAHHDLTVVSYHGGVEYALEAEPAKLRFFERLIDVGADVVHGHHPHVLQRHSTPYRAGARKLVLASTGNLVSAMGVRVGPQDVTLPQAFAADGALYRVLVQWRGSAAEVVEVAPVLTTTARNANGELVIQTLAAAADGARGEWAEFYRRRWNIMRDMYCPACGPRRVARAATAGRLR